MRKVYACVFFPPFCFPRPSPWRRDIVVSRLGRQPHGRRGGAAGGGMGGWAGGKPVNIYFCEGLQILLVILSKLFAEGMSRRRRRCRRAQTNNPQNAGRDSGSLLLSCISREGRRNEICRRSVAAKVRFSAEHYLRQDKLTENKLTRVEIARYHFDGNSENREEETGRENVSGRNLHERISRISRPIDSEERRKAAGGNETTSSIAPLMPCFIFD